MPQIPTPTFSSTIDQSFFIEPVEGTRPVGNFLDRFPDELYNKTIDSRLVKFMYALLGPAGVASAKVNLAHARLLIEQQGIQLFNLEQFYSDPFSFGRILDEIYDVDPTGLISQSDWEVIRAADESYRARALAFFNGAQRGTAPAGMALVAQSGLGHEVEIIENYRYLFDNHSIDRLGVPYMGKTYETSEFIVIPRQAISRTSVQTLTFDLPYNSGVFILGYNGQFTTPISWSATPNDIQQALQTLSTIGSGNVAVAGAWISNNLSVVTITFTGSLANTSVNTIEAISGLQDLSSDVVPRNRAITVDEMTTGLDPTDEVVDIRDANLHALQTALDFTRPILGLPTVYPGTGLRKIQQWQSVISTSDASTVVQTVTGNPSVNWPIDNPQFWIRQSVEVEAPRTYTDRLHHYIAFHRVKRITAYTDLALEDPDYLNDVVQLPKHISCHAGRFAPEDCRWIPWYITFNEEIKDDDGVILIADFALAEEPNVPIVRSVVDDEQLIDGVYPLSYIDLPDVEAPAEIASHRAFWASCGRISGDEYLEIDLGQVRPVNYLEIDIMQKPIDIEIDFDTLDQYPRRNWKPVTPDQLHIYPARCHYTHDCFYRGPWLRNHFHFGDASGAPIFTRHLRLRFQRRVSLHPILDLDFDGFMFDPIRLFSHPWTIDCRYLRIGRAISL